jgi:hypothetical protein
VRNLHDYRRHNQRSSRLSSPVDNRRRNHR